MHHKHKKNQIEVKIKNKFFEFSLSGKSLLLAISGGIDSMALLDLCHKLSSNLDIRLSICHVDHQLQKSSQKVAHFVETECNTRDLGFHLKKVDVLSEMKKNKESLEMSAHRLRKKVLLDLRQNINANYILTAHHQDDQIETILMRIGFGTGRQGINGLSEKNGFFIKPFLELSKVEIEAYQKKFQFRFISDTSNSDSSILRNFWRNDVLPIIRTRYQNGFEKNLLKTVSNINWRKEDHLLLKSEVSNLNLENETLQVNINRLKQYFSDFLKVFIETLLEQYFNISYHLNSNEFKKLLQIIHHEKSGKRIFIRKQILITKSFSCLSISKLEINDRQEIEIEIGKSYKIRSMIFTINVAEKANINSNRNIEFVDADNINGKLYLRQVMSNDSFNPIGFGHKQSLNRYLKSKQIAQEERKKQFVLEDDNGIIWLLGHRMDDRYKLSKTTETILKLELQHDSKK